MPKKSWKKYPCKYCGKLIKCNAYKPGARKVQLEKHENSCSQMVYREFDIENDNWSLELLFGQINIYDINDYSDLDYIYLWCFDYDVWIPYSLENQITIQKQINNNKFIIDIVEYRYSHIPRLNTITKIEININDMTQFVRSINNLTTFQNKRNIKKIKYSTNKKIISFYKNKSNNYSSEWIDYPFFYDNVLSIQYNFCRIELPIDKINHIIYNTFNTDYMDKPILNILPPNIHIHKIYKIQNPTQYNNYEFCKKSLYSHLQFDDNGKIKYNKFEEYLDIAKIPENQLCEKINDSEYINNKNLVQSHGIAPYETIVFHGCFDKGLINSICANGFHTHLCNNALYGTGSYFSSTFDYCHNNGYCASIDKNISQLFICKIVTGSFCIGKSQQKIPPLIPNSFKRYKTMVDNIENPQIFAIQDPSQIQILYEIIYSV